MAPPNYKIEQTYVPFGEFSPDLRFFANDGLLTANNVVPVYGDYISSPALNRLGNTSTTKSVRGLHVDPISGFGYAWLQDKIYECEEDGTMTDRAGAAYTGTHGAVGCSFGTTVVMTDYENAVQRLLVPGSGTFGDLIASTFAPKAKFAFPFRANLFLANLNLSAPYDGLASGANPTTVAWSQNDVPSQFGSFNADPQIRGAGYQPLNFDIGDITAACAGADYALIGHPNGITRVDGPPYTFRVVARNYGCLFPYGMCVVDRDAYLWTPAGLGRMRGGDGPIEIIGLGKFVRFLIDNSTGFSPTPFMTMGLLDTIEAYHAVSMAHDPINNILFVAYSHYDTETAENRGYSRALLAYNITEDRLTWFQLRYQAEANPSMAMFLRSGRQNPPSSWCPGRDIRFLSTHDISTSADWYYSKFALGRNFGDSVMVRGYTQFSKDATTRIRRVRPIYSVTSENAALKFSCYIRSTNKPYATLSGGGSIEPSVKGPFSRVDSHGWITTPGAVTADFHAPHFILADSADTYKNVELQGYEAEFEVYGRH